MQEPQSLNLPEHFENTPVRVRSKRQGPRRAGKIFYFHWNRKEFNERSARLRMAGHEVRGHWDPERVAKLGDSMPDVFVISLDRLPSHGRAYAG